MNAQGSLRDWDRGTVYGLVWENWQSGAGGVGRVGYGIGVNYGLLPLDEQQFLSEFLTPQGTRATSASASNASVLEIETNLRFRIPSPFIMPSFSLGLGYSTIVRRRSLIRRTARRHRPPSNVAMAENSRFGGELDKRIVDRVAIYGEATYTYGFTGLGQGIARPGGTCATSTSGCDPLKNTSLGMVRGGLRVHIGG